MVSYYLLNIAPRLLWEDSLLVQENNTAVQSLFSQAPVNLDARRKGITRHYTSSDSVPETEYCLRQDASAALALLPEATHYLVSDKDPASLSAAVNQIPIKAVIHPDALLPESYVSGIAAVYMLSDAEAKARMLVIGSQRIQPWDTGTGTLDGIVHLQPDPGFSLVVVSELVELLLDIGDDNFSSGFEALYTLLDHTLKAHQEDAAKMPRAGTLTSDSTGLEFDVTLSYQPAALKRKRHQLQGNVFTNPLTTPTIEIADYSPAVA